jgi:hypothetical protein
MNRVLIDVGNFEYESCLRIDLEGKSQTIIEILHKYLEVLSEIKVAKFKQEDINSLAAMKQPRKTVNLLKKVLIKKQQSIKNIAFNSYFKNLLKLDEFSSENPLGSLSLVKKSSGLPLLLIENSPPQASNDFVESNVMESLKKSIVETNEESDIANRLLRKENDFYKNSIQYIQNELDHYRDIKLDNNMIVKAYVEHQNKLFEKEVANFAATIGLMKLLNEDEHKIERLIYII